MLNWLKQHWWIPALAAIWLLFECWISWLASCQVPYSGEAADHYYQEHCTAFGGPIFSFFYFVLVWIGHFLKTYEHELIAGFTIVLAVSTIGLWLSTKHLWVTTRSAVDLANKEFASTHRPRMRLKHAWFTDQAAWRLGGPLEINFDFVNIGNASAHIEWLNYQSLLVPQGQPLPQRPPYDEPVPPGFGPITRFRTVADLRSGITLARPACDGILDNAQVLDILWGRQRLFLIGTIEYWDYAGLRQTAFCRRLAYETYPPAAGDIGRFVIENDPDYEYED